MREERVMKSILNAYRDALVQDINWAKSDTFFFNIRENLWRVIIDVFGVRMGRLPSKLLGVPLFVGADKTQLWNQLVDKCTKTMEGWKSRWLTFFGLAYAS